MFMEVQFEDIVFGIFPKVGAEALYAFGYWPKNSVGDIVDILLQMLEVSSTWDMSSLSIFYFFKRHLNLFTTWILPSFFLNLWWAARLLVCYKKVSCKWGSFQVHSPHLLAIIQMVSDALQDHKQYLTAVQCLACNFNSVLGEFSSFKLALIVKWCNL